MNNQEVLKSFLQGYKAKTPTRNIQSQLKRLATDFYNDKNIIYYEQKW
jgi:hypothetical protein